MKIFKSIAIIFIVSLMMTSCEKNEINDINEEVETVLVQKEGTKEKLRLDYHEKYGVVKAHEYPMNPKGVQEEPTLEDFLEKSDLKKEELLDYRIVKDEFSGVGLAEHRMEDGNVINVPHRFEREPVYKLEGKTIHGKKIIIIIIIRCANGMIIDVIVIEF